MKRVMGLLFLCIMLGGCIWAAQADLSVKGQHTELSAAGSQTMVSKEDVFVENVSEEVSDTDVQLEQAEAVKETVTEETTEDSVEKPTGKAEKETAEGEATKDEDVDTPLEKDYVVTLLDVPKLMYATVDLNVRSGPSTDYEVVSRLKIAQEVNVTGQADTGWYQVLADGRTAYVSEKYLSQEPVEVPQPTPTTEPPAGSTPEGSTPTGSSVPTASVAPAGVIMVGDSRCVQMQAAVGGGGCSWICENSKEYTWFSQIAIPKFDQYVGSGTKVVINMGVNDPEHYRQYAELVNVKAAEWAARGARTYFVSVNPVWENPYTTQEQVDTFNANMPGLLSGVTWIDTSSWLNTNGYRLVDGLHFDDPTSVTIFNLIMGSL